MKKNLKNKQTNFGKDFDKTSMKTSKTSIKSNKILWDYVKNKNMRKFT